VLFIFTVKKEWYKEVIANLQEAIHLKHFKLWMAKDWVLLHNTALAHLLLLVQQAWYCGASPPTTLFQSYTMQGIPPSVDGTAEGLSLQECSSFKWLPKLHRRLHAVTSRNVSNCTNIDRSVKMVKGSIFTSTTSMCEIYVSPEYWYLPTSPHSITTQNSNIAHRSASQCHQI
jgi:hypothetical protein